MRLLQRALSFARRTAYSFRYCTTRDLCSLALIVVGVGLIIQGLRDPASALTSWVFYWICAAGWLFFKNSNYHRVYVSFCVVSSVTAALALCQFFYTYPIPPTSWFNNQNSLAYFMVLSMIIVLDHRLASVADWCQLVIYGIVVLLAWCHGALLVLAVGVALIAFSYRDRLARSMVMPISAVALGCVIATSSLRSFLWRPLIWLCVLPGVPVFGAGLDAVSDRLLYFGQPDQIWHAHNAIVQAAGTIGWLPALLILSLGCVLIWRLWSMRKPSAYLMISWLVVSSMVDYLYWWPGFGLAALMVLHQIIPARAWSGVGSPAPFLLSEARPNVAAIIRLCLLVALLFPGAIALADYSSDVTKTTYAISSSDYNETTPNTKAFDNTSGYWMSGESGAGVPSVAYIGQDFGSSAHSIRQVTFQQHALSNYGVTSLFFQYSDDCTNWFTTNLFSVDTGDAIQTLTLSSDYGAHRCWRFLANSAPVSYWAVIEIEMQLYTPDPTPTESTTATPTESVLVFGTLENSGLAYQIERSATYGDVGVFAGLVFVGVVGLLGVFLKVAHGSITR
jgi:hypothetical protein